MALHKRGIDPQAATFDATKAGKPYLADPVPSPPIAFNVAHDNAIITISFSSNAHNPPAYSLGIDVMKVHLPRHDTFHSFIESMSEVLTPLEYRQVTAGNSDRENLRCFFWTWTMKEAFTKAAGSGLGFDLRRVEYDAKLETLRVDGTLLAGWQFNKFVIQVEGDVYQGVIAEYTSGKQLKIVEESAGLPDYMVVYDAVPFVENALQQLS